MYTLNNFKVLSYQLIALNYNQPAKVPIFPRKTGWMDPVRSVNKHIAMIAIVAGHQARSDVVG